MGDSRRCQREDRVEDDQNTFYKCMKFSKYKYKIHLF